MDRCPADGQLAFRFWRQNTAGQQATIGRWARHSAGLSAHHGAPFRSVCAPGEGSSRSRGTARDSLESGQRR